MFDDMPNYNDCPPPNIPTTPKEDLPKSEVDKEMDAFCDFFDKYRKEVQQLINHRPIQVIKELRCRFHLGLVEAKQMVDGILALFSFPEVKANEERAKEVQELRERNNQLESENRNLTCAFDTLHCEKSSMEEVLKWNEEQVEQLKKQVGALETLIKIYIP